MVGIDPKLTKALRQRKIAADVILQAAEYFGFDGLDLEWIKAEPSTFIPVYTAKIEPFEISFMAHVFLDFRGNSLNWYYAGITSPEKYRTGMTRSKDEFMDSLQAAIDDIKENDIKNASRYLIDEANRVLGLRRTLTKEEEEELYNGYLKSIK